MLIVRTWFDIRLYSTSSSTGCVVQRTAVCGWRTSRNRLGLESLDINFQTALRAQKRLWTDCLSVEDSLALKLIKDKSEYLKLLKADFPTSCTHGGHELIVGCYHTMRVAVCSENLCKNWIFWILNTALGIWILASWLRLSLAGDRSIVFFWNSVSLQHSGF